MAKKLTVDNLQSEIDKILEDYADDVYENLDVITKKIGQKGAQAVRNTAKTKVKGTTYASGWTSTAYKNRLYTSVVIYNKKQAGLSHLLEHGHVSSNGVGRNYQTEDAPVKAREHILPVEEKLVAEYEREVVSKL